MRDRTETQPCLPPLSCTPLHMLKARHSQRQKEGTLEAPGLAGQGGHLGHISLGQP